MKISMTLVSEVR